MRLLRDNKETLLSVLEPFLRDPTVAWGRSGRAQRSEIAATASTSTFLSRAGVARMRQTRLSSPDQGGDIQKTNGRSCLSHCVLLSALTYAISPTPLHHALHTTHHTGTKSGAVEVQENADAKDALEKIGGRLSGIYNLTNPNKNKILRGYAKRKAGPPAWGLGALQVRLFYLIFF